jgi:hypothetical protein
MRESRITLMSLRARFIKTRGCVQGGIKRRIVFFDMQNINNVGRL